MDKNLIYVKTEAGAEAIRTRTGVVRRNERVVLVLVDGKSTVGQLGEKAGDPARVATALAGLEKGGFIKRLDAEAAEGELLSEPGPEPGPGPGPVSRGVDRAARWRERVESVLAVRHASSRAPSRGRRGAWLLGFVIVAAGLAWLFPTERYRPEIEADVARLVGQPVHAGSLHWSVYPSPGLILEQVVIGSDPGPIEVGRVRLAPTLSGWWRSERDYSLVEFDGLALAPPDLAKVAAWLQQQKGSAATAPAGRLEFRNLALEIEGARFAEFDGGVEVSDAGATRRIALNARDQPLRVAIAGAGPTFELAIEASGWRPTKYWPVAFTSLLAKGHCDAGGCSFGVVDVQMLGGSVRGQLEADWKAGPVRSHGSFTVEGVNVAKLADALGAPGRIEGEIAGNLHYTGSGLDFGALACNGGFVARRGSLKGFDFVDAMRRSADRPSRGGTTNFETLTGRFAFDARGGQLSALALSSGLLQLSGGVAVGPDRRLSGSVDTRLRGSVSETRKVVTVSGTLSAPELSPR